MRATQRRQDSPAIGEDAPVESPEKKVEEQLLRRELLPYQLPVTHLAGCLGRPLGIIRLSTCDCPALVAGPVRSTSRRGGRRRTARGSGGDIEDRS